MSSATIEKPISPRAAIRARIKERKSVPSTGNLRKSNRAEDVYNLEDPNRIIGRPEIGVVSSFQIDPTPVQGSPQESYFEYPQSRGLCGCGPMFGIRAREHQSVKKAAEAAAFDASLLMEKLVRLHNKLRIDFF
jgi:hypothetical protein